jgi:hypothetical protein
MTHPKMFVTWTLMHVKSNIDEMYMVQQREFYSTNFDIHVSTTILSITTFQFKIE